MAKFTSTRTRIQVGNGQYIGVLFVIPVIMTIQSHKFKIFTLVSEIHENINLVIGIKNLFELEGVIDSQDSCVKLTKQVNTLLSKRESLCETKRAKNYGS